MSIFDIGKAIIGLGAPILGTALGGPLGGAAGSILASALGTSDTSETGLKIALEKLDPDGARKAVAEAEAEWARTLRAEAETAGIAVKAINETARAEVGSEDAFVRRARPTVLWVFSVVSVMFCLVLVASIAVVVYRFDAAGIATAITALVGLIGSLAMLLGVIAFPATGYVFGRSREKQTAMTGEPSPGVVGTLIKAFKR